MKGPERGLLLLFIVSDIMLNMKTKKYIVIGIYLLASVVFPVLNIVTLGWDIGWSQHRIIFLIALVTPLLISWLAFYYVKKSEEPKWSTLLVILILSASYSIHANNDSEASVGFFLGPFFDKSDVGANVYTLLMPLGALYHLLSRNRKLGK